MCYTALTASLSEFVRPPLDEPPSQSPPASLQRPQERALCDLHPAHKKKLGLGQTPGGTIRFSSYRKERDKRRLRWETRTGNFTGIISHAARRRQEEILMGDKSLSGHFFTPATQRASTTHPCKLEEPSAWTPSSWSLAWELPPPDGQ